MSTRQQSFAVAVYGVPEFERKVLERIFSLTATRENRYRVADDDGLDDADMVLVDRENASALAGAKAFLEQHPTATVVHIVGQPSAAGEYSVRRPFTATRILAAFDDAVSAAARRAAATAAAAAVPAAAPAAAPAPEAAPGEAPAPAAPGAGYRALVVDDSLPVRKQVGMALARTGIGADFADNGKAALALVAQNAYDVIFLDVIMPGMDGYEVCRAIKRDRERRHTPVVMLTGKSSPFDKVRGKLSGCDTYLTKPVSLKEFTRTLNRCLGQPLAFESMAGLG